MKFAITKKTGMTRLFDDNGRVVPVSVLRVIPTKVSAIKNKTKHGYSAVVVQEDRKKKNSKNKQFEFKVKNETIYKVGDKIRTDVFVIGDKVEVKGKSKGKGYTGAIKRHGFSRGPESHGSSHHRRTGAIGGAYPQRVVKGKKMPGRVGNNNVTAKNLLVAEINDNLIFVTGSVPGPTKGIIKIYSI